MTDYRNIRHFLDQRQLVLAEHKIEAALADLSEYTRYTERGEGSPDGFCVSVTDDIQQAITRLSDTLDKLKFENEYQKQAAISRIAEIRPLQKQAHELFMTIIPTEIAVARNVPIHADERHNADIVRYERAGLRRDEAEKLLEPRMSDIERNEWLDKAEKLETELNKIGEWLVDVPRFDPAVLAGTRLEEMAI